ncbi:Crp/Fnr family transcriptional regulator [Nitratireductor sp. ZSWI3]|uniref:Crp/Fnr family transcriptional regulator n=1 Tax=Nitratireductor sp. ZSWI3 TaxID=2966359 RepID=UPI00214FE4F8|nr:Crp/Fnr family transcriptional regulator [Nitratireductor sp. ZSWI3]MCR4268772.1 Crp/Fnr family transcriptional regulator [Nitratireductor sp. ZSWI3]
MAEGMLANGAGNFREILHYLESETAQSLFGSKARRLEHTGLKKRVYSSGETIADSEDMRRAVLLIVSGWVACGKELTDGSRTVVDFCLTGDVVTLGSTEWARESVMAVTPVTLFEFPGAIYENLSTYPRHVREFVLKGMARRYARTAEHFVSISRRDAVERVAHLLLELSYRVGVREEGGNARFPCPLTQVDLGDALGLSVVHVNRVLRKLREAGYVSFRGGVVEFYNRQRLVDTVGFDDAYLALNIG